MANQTITSSKIATALTCKLTRSNYLLWKSQVVPTLRGVKLFGYLDGSKVKPAEKITTGTGDAAHQTENPEYEEWVTQDQAILGGLLSSMTEEVLSQLTRCADTSNQLWVTLQTMFSAQHRGNSIQLRTQLSNTKKGDLTASEYYQKMISLADTMANIGHPMTDEEVIGYILAGLGPGHGDLFTAITVLSNNQTVTLSEFYSYLIAHEAQQLAMGTGTSTDFTSSANSVTKQVTNNTRKQQTNQVFNNNQRNNYRNNGNRGRGRGRGRFGSGPRCQVCSIPGHTALNCRNRFNHSYQSEEYRGANTATFGNYTNDPNWYLDTGATDHLTNDLDRLSIPERYHGKEQVQVANGTGLHISHVGHSKIPSFGRPLILKNILHVPHINKHLLSANKLVTDNHVFIELYPHVFFVKDIITKKILLIGRSKRGLFPVPIRHTPHYAGSINKVSSSQWHQRLGHPTSAIVKSVVRSNNLGVSFNNESAVCDACQRGKSHQLPYNNSVHVTLSPLELVHTDVWGPAQVSSGGFRYYVSFLDDFSRYTWIYCIKRKSDVEQVFYNFQNHVERLLNAKIRTIQSDWGGEYHKLHTYFQQCGISHRVSCPHTSQQNGMAERKHRHIVETGLALLAHSSLPLRYWDEAFLTACFLINRMPSRTIQNLAPITRLLNIKPDYTFLRTFGCACWPNLRKYNTHKLAFRSIMCVFLGYSSKHKGYKCLDKQTGRVYISRDVVFDESRFPFSTSVSHVPPSSPSVGFPQNEPNVMNDHMNKYDISLLLANLSDAATDRTHDVSSQTSTSAGAHTIPVPTISPSSVGAAPSHSTGSSAPVVQVPAVPAPDHIAVQPPSPGPVSPVAPAVHNPPAAPTGVLTRGQAGKFFPKQFSDGTVLYNPHRRAFFAEPTSHQRALTDPKWKLAMENDNVSLWKKALKEVPDLAGMVLSGSEAKFVKEIVDIIYNKLDRKEVSLPQNITGMASRYEDISVWLNQPDVEFLAICGMGGSGKTTLAKYIYHSNWKTYENMSFVEGIREKCEQPDGMRVLQEQLLKGILGGKKRKIPSVSEGTCKIEDALKTKRSLIVLDDIVERSQLVALLGTGKINPQSKIIITTTRENTYDWFKFTDWRCQDYEMKLLKHEESLELLSRHAFGSKVPMEGFTEVAEQAVLYCGGNPLALEVLASALSQENTIVHWESQLNTLEKEIDSRIQNVLIMSYKSLSFDLEKELFLHIACFFVGKDKDYVVKILQHDYDAASGITSLSNRHLLSVSPNKKLMMHRLLQEMGKNIVRQESKFPEQRSRVWLSGDSYKILSKGKGSETMEGLALDMQILEEQKFAFKSSNLKTDALQKMDRLKLLQLNFVQLTGSYDNLSEDLRWLCWLGSNLRTIPSDLFMGNLVAIDMSYSKLEIFEPPTVLPSLQILNLTHSHNLREVRNMSMIPHLETLILWNCHSLSRVCETIGDLTSLALLNMTGCRNLCKSEQTEASTSGGGVAQQPTFFFPRSLYRLFLKDCDLECTESFPLSFSVQLSLQYMNLGNSLFEFLPCYDHLKNLRVLDLSLCSMLKQLICLPSTLAELYVYYCKSLEEISFQSHRFTLQEFGYEGCISLLEIEGFIKLVPVAKLEENDLGHMMWLKEYQNHEVCLAGDDELTKDRSSCVQILYEFNIMSTSLPDMEDPNMKSTYVSELSSLSFDVPPPPKHRRLKGIDVTFKYTISGEDDGLWFCKISTSNGVHLMYNPKVFGKPESGEVGIWLSYWPIGNALETGDKVNVSIAVISGLEVHECGVSLVYTDDKVAEETLENNMGLVQVLGGDVSGFQISTGAYYLCRRDLFELMEVGRLTTDWFSILVGDTIDCTEVRGWRKTGRPLQLKPSFTELKFVRCIVHGPESEDIYKIAEMSKSSFVDKTLEFTSSLLGETMKSSTSSKFSGTTIKVKPQEMAMLLSESISKLYATIIYVAETTPNFKPELKQLCVTLDIIAPIIHEMVNMSHKLDHKELDYQLFIEEIEEDAKLVAKCLKVKWNIIKKFKYSLKLKDLNAKLLRFFQMEVQAFQVRDITQSLLEVKDMKLKMDSLALDVKDMVVRTSWIDNYGGSTSTSSGNEIFEREKYGWRVPSLPKGIVGFDEPLAKLKAEVVAGIDIDDDDGSSMDSDDHSVLVVAASAACGKTTLVKMLCHDPEIRDKFGENIFFVTVSETPNFMVIVNDLFNPNSSAPQLLFQSNEDAKNKLESFLNQKVSGPMLLVLDDVWSHSFIDNFPSKNRGCKILVTSRTAFTNYDVFTFDPLNEKDAKTLFCQSAFTKDGKRPSPIIDENLVNQMVTCCKRHPLALSVVGRSLNGKDEFIWKSMLKKLSQGRSVLDLHEEVLTRLERSFEALDDEFKQCFLDLGLFPEDRRIPVSALLNMWAHLYNHDDDGVATMTTIFGLSFRNLVTLMATGFRNERGAIVNYCNRQFVTQHDLLRELAIHLNSKLPLPQRSRLTIDAQGEDFPAYIEQVQEPMQARILSISTGESFSSRWYNMEVPNLEVLILNLMSKSYTLPPFLAGMRKLKILNISNHGLYPTQFKNFHLLTSAHYLTRIRLERVTIFPSILSLRNLEKVSFIMCKIGKTFKKRMVNTPNIWPELDELEIDYCRDLVEFPGMLCKSVHLKKISITNCNEMRGFSEEFGDLMSLETLILRSCTKLKQLPESIWRSEKLSVLDISDCLSLSGLPEKIGKLAGLRKIYMKGCTGVHELPKSVGELPRVRVACDEEITSLWLEYSNVEIDWWKIDRKP